MKYVVMHLTCSNISLGRSSCSSMVSMALLISSLESFNLQEIDLTEFLSLAIMSEHILVMTTLGSLVW